MEGVRMYINIVGVIVWGAEAKGTNGDIMSEVIQH